VASEKTTQLLLTPIMEGPLFSRPILYLYANGAPSIGMPHTNIARMRCCAKYTFSYFFANAPDMKADFASNLNRG